MDDGFPECFVPESPAIIKFGNFQLDLEAGQLLKNGRVVRLKPQPFKLLHLLASRPGELLTRDEIRSVLWGSGTYVDFEQGVNTAVRQIREALNDDADSPLYLETVPKRGYRFIGPVETASTPDAALRKTDLNLHKALWLNIAELRLAEVRRRRFRRQLFTGLIIAGTVLAAFAALLFFLR
jgi:DNA-binding winged helix-turn-helix (wHTH) protein